MPAPIVPLVILALGAAGLGWAALSKRPGAAGGAAVQDLAQKVANKGPNGEWVFKDAVAESIVKSLSGQTYQYVDQNARDVVKVAPDPRGLPIATSNTARAWAGAMNEQFSILAPLYMATSSPADRFLRAVPAGQEASFTGPETGFAVLAYVGALAKGKVPGSPPGGGTVVPLDSPPATPGLPSLPVPGAPGGGIPASIPSIPGGVTPAGFNPLGSQEEIRRQLADLCLNGVNPEAMEAVANTAELFGFVEEAKCLRGKAAQLRASQRPAGPPPVPGIPAAPAPPPAAPAAPAPTLTPQFAVVTTSEPPPMGDLIIRATPSTQGPVRQFPQGTGSPNQIGGAHKNGIVEVLRKLNAEGTEWAEIIWKGDNRTFPNNWPPVRGFAKAQFLRPTAQAPVAPAPAVAPAAPALPGGFTPSPDLITSAAQAAAALLPKMRVTTNDPAPSGDIFIVAAPGMPGTPGVGAEKNGLVDVLNPVPIAGPDGNLWLNVRWNGGVRLKPVTGFAKAKFLTPVPSTTISGVASAVVDGQGRLATVASSSGMRLRDRPGPHGNTISLVPANARVRLLQVAPGKKADTRSPGPGGWARVEYEGRPGWVQAEWLLLG